MNRCKCSAEDQKLVKINKKIVCDKCGIELTFARPIQEKILLTIPKKQ